MHIGRGFSIDAGFCALNLFGFACESAATFLQMRMTEITGISAVFASCAVQANHTDCITCSAVICCQYTVAYASSAHFKIEPEIEFGRIANLKGLNSIPSTAFVDALECSELERFVTNHKTYILARTHLCTF